jgi:uncharacterized protein involved in exopolysaccharide biosynthesis
MLQKLDISQEEMEVPPNKGHLLRLSYYWEFARRRAFLLVVPFLVVSIAGAALALLWPATYLSEGKILVQSQQIPTELVRPTVTNAAQERIQVIEQRTMTRENLMAIIDKFQLFPEKRTLMSVTQLVELMRKSAKIEPIAQPLAFARSNSRSENPTIVFTVGFEYQDALTATRVANELVTRILNEDLRDRTSRATDTTKFLGREVQRLQAENAAIDAKVTQAKALQTRPVSPGAPDPSASQLSLLRAEAAQKSALYSERHPQMLALKRQIAAMEKAAVPAPVVGQDQPAGLDVLENQLETVQKNLEIATARLMAARLGETLEKDQQSEKLEVIEQPTTPQEPVRPNRPKIAGLALILALVASSGLALVAEAADKAIRRSSDIFTVVDSHLVISIPYITTKAELRRKKVRTVMMVMVLLLIVVGAVVAGYFFLPPLDLIIAKARVGLFR